MIDAPGLAVEFPPATWPTLALALELGIAALRRDGVIVRPDFAARALTVRHLTRPERLGVPGRVPPGTSSDQELHEGRSENPGTPPKMTSRELAERAGVEDRWVRKLAQTGRLPADRTPDGYEFDVDNEEVAEWLKARGDRGSRAG